MMSGGGWGEDVGNSFLGDLEGIKLRESDGDEDGNLVQEVVFNNVIFNSSNIFSLIPLQIRLPLTLTTP